MAEFQLSITRRIENPDFEVQLKTWEEANKYSQYSGFNDRPPAPERFIESQTLSITVNEETFNAIRKAALETL